MGPVMPQAMACSFVTTPVPANRSRTMRLPSTSFSTSARKRGMDSSSARQRGTKSSGTSIARPPTRT